MAYIDGMEQFNLKMWRKAHKLTQATLADRLGVSKRTVINWEHGDTGAAGNLVELACKALEHD